MPDVCVSVCTLTPAALTSVPVSVAVAVDSSPVTAVAAVVAVAAVSLIT